VDLGLGGPLGLARVWNVWGNVAMLMHAESTEDSVLEHASILIHAEPSTRYCSYVKLCVTDVRRVTGSCAVKPGE